MIKTKQQTFRLGLFVIIGLVIFVMAIYFIGKKKNMFDKNFTISANFSNVNGLMHGNNVRYSGINVGTVKRIIMLNDSVINVELIISENMTQHIRKDAIASIGSDGLVGNMIVNITPGNGSAAQIVNGDVIKSYAKTGTDEMLDTLSSTNENVALLASKVLEIVNDIAEGKGTLGMLINDTLVANDMKKMLFNLKHASMEANKTMVQLNDLVGQINMKESVAGVLLTDKNEANKVKQIISNLESSSLEIQAILSNLKDGEGVINYISNDPDVVKKLNESIKNIEEGTDKFNQNMEALKHNFLTRGYFKKLEKEEKKTEKD
ncbi:MAG: MlaD family protein [Xanthomarina sp.]